MHDLVSEAVAVRGELPVREVVPDLLGVNDWLVVPESELVADCVGDEDCVVEPVTVMLGDAASVAVLDGERDAVGEMVVVKDGVGL